MVVKSYAHRYLSIIGLVCLLACGQPNDNGFRTFRGKVFGTYYRVKIHSNRDFTKAIDSIFALVDKAINTYSADSELSRLNSMGALGAPSLTLRDLMNRAEGYHKLSNGYFEPTLYPLIQFWKLGNTIPQIRSDSVRLDQLRTLVSFSKNVRMTPDSIVFNKAGTQLDLTAIGEGYTIEILSNYLSGEGVPDYLIEIGGEVYAKGLNEKKETWTIGIEDPAKANANHFGDIISKVALDGKGISTSGSYRKFYMDSLGNKHPHIIDPKTGFPVRHHLLSASVLDSSPARADAMATAFMAMGLERAKSFLEKQGGLEAQLVFIKNDGIAVWHTPNFYGHQQ